MNSGRNVVPEGCYSDQDEVKFWKEFKAYTSFKTLQSIWEVQQLNNTIQFSNSRSSGLCLHVVL